MSLTEAGSKVFNLLQQGQAFKNPVAGITDGISSAATELSSALPTIVNQATAMGVEGVEQLKSFASLVTGEGIQAGKELAGHIIFSETYDKFFKNGLTSFSQGFEEHTTNLISNMHTHIPFVGSYRSMRQEIQNSVPAASTMAMAADAANAGSICDFLNNVFGSVMGAVNSVINGIKSAINAILDPIKDLFNSITSGSGDILGKIKSVIGTITDAIGNIMNKIMTVVNQVMAEIANLATMMTEMLQ